MRVVVAIVAAAFASAAVVGVARGERHGPVAIQPDAKRVGDAAVATFALG